MDNPVVTPVESTPPEGELRLWAAPRMVVVTQFVAGVVFLVMALVNLAGSEPSGWERFIGVVAALVAGMAFGVAGSLRVQGRMVRRHLAGCQAPTTAPTTAPATGPTTGTTTYTVDR
jgi:protein-S-isoprenylcysteine O-methyltransferase Ste14